jgi:upstream activation factor subunit UAF30
MRWGDSVAVMPQAQGDAFALPRPLELSATGKLSRDRCIYAHLPSLIRYNSCDREVGHACPKDGERKMAKAKTAPKTNSAFMKPMQPSEHLSKIVGTEPLPRSEVTKKIWAYIKKHSLQNPKNKREILADEKLQPIFGTKKLDMFQMTKAVNKHLK